MSWTRDQLKLELDNLGIPYRSGDLKSTLFKLYEGELSPVPLRRYTNDNNETNENNEDNETENQTDNETEDDETDNETDNETDKQYYDEEDEEEEEEEEDEDEKYYGGKTELGNYWLINSNI